MIEYRLAGFPGLTRYSASIDGGVLQRIIFASFCRDVPQNLIAFHKIKPKQSLYLGLQTCPCSWYSGFLFLSRNLRATRHSKDCAVFILMCLAVLSRSMLSRSTLHPSPDFVFANQSTTFEISLESYIVDVCAFCWLRRDILSSRYLRQTMEDIPVLSFKHVRTGAIKSRIARGFAR